MTHSDDCICLSLDFVSMFPDFVTTTAGLAEYFDDEADDEEGDC